MEIILENVCKKLRGSEIIRDVSLTLKSGRIYGLEGYNGSGKTMLLRHIAGLLRPTEGRVLIDGKELGRDMDFPPSIGVLLESPGFLPNYTGVENLELIASLTGNVDQKKIRETLCRVGLNPEDKRKYRKYSLGMKQRLGIACAVFDSPAIILLDEPTNALDRDGVILVNDIILEERDRGALIVMACHEKKRLDVLADVIYTMEHGRIVGIRERGA